MSRISAFRKKIKSLQEKNNDLEISNSKCNYYIEKYKKELNESKVAAAIKDIKITELENKFSLKYIAAKEKEITDLKQELKRMQLDIRISQHKLDNSDRNLKNANENIVRLDAHIEDLESKKIKNRIKKLLVG